MPEAVTPVTPVKAPGGESQPAQGGPPPAGDQPANQPAQDQTAPANPPAQEPTPPPAEQPTTAQPAPEQPVVSTAAGPERIWRAYR
jgi:hypothetical protein